jgi:hypothetical protein
MTAPAHDYGRARTFARIAAPKQLHLVVLENDGRPKTRAECADVPRPCPYASCQWHLYADHHRESLRAGFSGGDVTKLNQSCALDLADGGPQTLEVVAEALGISPERARQIEERALAKLAQFRGVLE